MNQILNKIDELGRLLEQENALNETVSSASVHWHADHSLRAIIGMSTAALESNPDEYKWRFNKLRTLVFTLNKIPRGRGKAPKISISKNEVDANETLLLVAKAKQRINEFSQLSPRHFYQHHLFGALNKRRTKKMIRLHTDHHLKIIADISKVG